MHPACCQILVVLCLLSEFSNAPACCQILVVLCLLSKSGNAPCLLSDSNSVLCLLSDSSIALRMLAGSICVVVIARPYSCYVRCQLLGNQCFSPHKSAFSRAVFVVTSGGLFIFDLLLFHARF